MSRPQMLRALSLLLIALLTSACSGLAHDETAGWEPEQFYEKAQEAKENGDFTGALDWLSRLEARYPYGRYAQQAQLETIYLHFKQGDRISTVAAAERFIKLNPRHQHVDYAYYLRALASAHEEEGIVEKLVPHEKGFRDSDSLRQAFTHFRELVTRFPDSRYYNDALRHMQALREHLAAYEVSVAEHYHSRGAYVAVVNRAKYVLEHYPRSREVPKALALMVKAYRAMGLDDLAADSLRILELNHPDHPSLTELRNAGGQLQGD